MYYISSSARPQRGRLRNQFRPDDGASHREQQRTAIYVAAAVCSTQAGGFGSHKAIDPLQMWPATVRAAQRRAAQLAGIGDVGEKQRLHARRRRAARQADCSTSTSCSCAACDRLALWMGIDEHGVFSAGWFRLACTRRPGGHVAGEGACCPTSRCAACGCRCCWYFCDIVGTGGASSDSGGLVKDGQLMADD